MKSRRLNWRVVGALVITLIVSAVLVHQSSIPTLVPFLSRFTVKELITLYSTLRSPKPNPLSSRLIIMQMRADQGGIREAPDPNSAIVSHVPAGTALRALSETRAWYRVEPHQDAAEPSFREGYVSVSDVHWIANCASSEVINLSPVDRFQDCAAAPEMVVLPAETFMMGSPPSEAYRQSDEGPQRRVEIAAPFAVGAYEVTFEQWDACQRTGGCTGIPPHDLGLGRGKRPVMNINWGQAQEYVQWLSAITGKRYRLLSEAEWEYAARAGTAAPRPGSAMEATICEHLNGLDETAMKLVPDVARSIGSTIPCADGYPAAAVVGTFRANAFGLFDMLGNIAEWTQDCYSASYLDSPADGSARDTGDCRYRVSRGGAWAFGLQENRVAARSKRTANSSYSSLGLRVARELD